MQPKDQFQLSYQAYPDPDGPLEIAYIPWDSNLFGFPVYELKVENTPLQKLSDHLPGLISTLAGSNPVLIVTRLPPHSVDTGQVLSQNGFYLVESQLELRLNLHQLKLLSNRRFPNIETVTAEAQDLPQVSAIAASTFMVDRFHLDPNLRSDLADQRYLQWVKNGFFSGDPLFICRDASSQKIFGFLHVREIQSELVDLLLAAVDRTHQSTGIGLTLYQEVLYQLRQKGFEIASTRVSINNLPMINLLVRLNFRVTNILVIYHYYFSPSG